MIHSRAHNQSNMVEAALRCEHVRLLFIDDLIDDHAKLTGCCFILQMVNDPKHTAKAILKRLYQGNELVSILHWPSHGQVMVGHTKLYFVVLNTIYVSLSEYKVEENGYSEGTCIHAHI